MTTAPNIEVRIIEGGLRAELHIAASADAAEVTPNALETLAEEAGVVLDEHSRAALRRFAAAFRSRPQQTRRVFARATMPVHGKDGALQWQRGFNPTVRAMARTPDGHLKMNHYAGTSYIHVEPGDHVASISQPTAGTDGCNVLGEPIKARPGQRCPVRFDPTIEIDDQHRVLARISGMLSLENNMLCIRNSLRIPGSVNFTTGNIDFDGSVEVVADIRSMFVVKTTSDLTVGGLIEAAIIECGGRFTCQHGMAAKDRGELNVAGHAEIGYLNNVKGTIGKNLMVRREIIDCDLVVKGAIDASTAAIIGGKLTVGGPLTIGVLGSKGCKPTIVEPGDEIRVLKELHQGVVILTRGMEIRFRDTITGEVSFTSNNGPPRLRRGEGSFIPLESVAILTKRAA